MLLTCDNSSCVIHFCNLFAFLANITYMFSCVVYIRRLLRRLITGGLGYTVPSAGRPNEPQDVALLLPGVDLSWIHSCVQAVTHVCYCAGQLCSIPFFSAFLSSQVVRDRFVLFGSNHRALKGTHTVCKKIEIRPGIKER